MLYAYDVERGFRVKHDSFDTLFTVEYEGIIVDADRVRYTATDSGLARLVLTVIGEVLRSGGGNIHDTQSAVLQLDRVRPTSNQFSTNAGTWNPAHRGPRTSGSVANLMDVLAGFEFLKVAALLETSDEARIAAAVQRLNELDVAA